MALSKTWYTSANRAMDDVTTAFKSNCSILFALKGFLTGALTGTAGTGGQPPSSSFWTVDSSCAFTGGSQQAGSTDKFSATFVAAEWVRAAAGVSHSWFVLKSPASSGITDGPWYLMVSQGTAADANIVIGLSKAQPTGGTSTADPTSSPAQSLYASAAFLPSSATNGKCHFVVDAKGNFHFGQSFNGGGRMVLYLSVNELIETRSSGDSGRVVLIVDMLNSSTGAPRLAAGAMLGSGVRGFANDGTTALTATTGKICTPSWNGSSDDSVRVLTNAIDSKVDGLPIAYIYDTTAAHQGVRGRLPDVSYVAAQVAVGSGTPTAAAPERVVMCDSLIPCSVALSL